MAIVHEIGWDEAFGPNFGNPQRAAWRMAIAEVAAKAKEKLPESAGRIDTAVKTVLQGDVLLLDGGKAQGGSQTDATKLHQVAPGSCDCRDFKQAAANLCKHRLAAVIVRGANELLQAPANQNGSVTVPDAPTMPQSAGSDTRAPVQSEVTAAPAATERKEAVPAPFPEARVSITVKGFKNGQEIMATFRGGGG